MNCSYLDIKKLKDKFSIEICSMEVFHQTFPSNSHQSHSEDSSISSDQRRFIDELNFLMIKKYTLEFRSYPVDFHLDKLNLGLPIRMDKLM